MSVDPVSLMMMASGGVKGISENGIALVGMLMQRNEMRRAAGEAKTIDARNFEYQKGRDIISDEFMGKQLALAKQQQGLNEKEFGLKKTITGMTAYTQQLDRVADILNKNEDLKNVTLQRWGL
jgi:hypothetical protein